MPRDDWARAKARDVARRVKREQDFKALRWKKPKKSKPQKRAKLSAQAQASKRLHEQKLGPSRPQASAAVRIVKGSHVEIRHADSPVWSHYVMRKTLTFATFQTVENHRVFAFDDWFIRLPAPRRF